MMGTICVTVEKKGVNDVRMECRVIKTQSTFAEFIVEAKTKEEAEAKINLKKM